MVDYECSHGDYPDHSKSKLISIGGSLSTKWGVIRVIRVYDSSSGLIGFTPTGWGYEVRQQMTDTYQWIVDEKIINVNFTTMGGGGASVQVCVKVEEIDPLRITAITVYEVSDPKSVIADVLINGEGTGTLSIAWGDQGTTTHAVNGAGQYYFEKSLPVGTHNICGSIGTTQECATIIIEDEPEIGELKVSKLELIQDVDSPGALIAQITMIGAGTGTLVIDWGDGTIERFEGYVAGLEKIGIEKPDSIIHVCAWIEGSELKECAYYIPMLYLLGIAGIGLIILVGLS